MTNTKVALPRAVFWDMDGTLIDSEPYWREAELKIAAENGGYWTEELGWKGSGTLVSSVAAHMIEHGTKLSVEELTQRLIDYVAQREQERMPWIPGVCEVLSALAQAGVPSILVTSSPRHMAGAVVAQAPEGAFRDCISGSDDLPKKPDPAPYLAAARLLGITGDTSDEIRECVALEDSSSGLQSAVASGATTIALSGFNRLHPVDGPQFTTIENYDGVTPEFLGDVVRRRLAQYRAQ